MDDEPEDIFAAFKNAGPDPSWQLPVRGWFNVSLIAILRVAVSLCNQWYEKVTPLETFVWAGKNLRTSPPLQEFMS